METILLTPITYLLLALISLLSYQALQNREFMEKFLFVPYYMVRQAGQGYRFLSAGFIHANLIHYVFNAFVLFEFGRLVELYYKRHFSDLGSVLYLTMYLAGLWFSGLYSYQKHKDNPSYRALGASGAVSGVVFAAILFEPTMPLTFIFLPFFSIPAIVLGFGYLLYSWYMSRYGRDNIGHDAHFWGALWGFVFTAALKPPLLLDFFKQLQLLFM